MGPQIWTADKSCLVCSSGGMLREVNACSLDLLLSDWKRREARAFIQAFSYKPVKPKVWLPCTAAAAGAWVQHVAPSESRGSEALCSSGFFSRRSIRLCVSGRGMFFVCAAVMCFWVWGKCGWCKKNCVMTPLWFTDPTQGPPCVGYKHRVPPLHDLTILTRLIPLPP